MRTLFLHYARWLLRRRLVVVVVMLAATALLGLQAKRLHFIIDPNTLLPQTHPYVETTNLFERVFGSRYVIVIAVMPKQGDVYQPAVLEKVRRITARLTEVLGVVKTNLLSVTARKVKDITGGADGVEVRPMTGNGTAVDEQVRVLREAVRRNPVYLGTLVSRDETVAAVLVEMREGSGGFRAMLEPVRAIAEAERDASTDIALGGNPVFLAYAEAFASRMAFLFPLAILLVGLIHFEAFRTVQGLILPLTTAILAVVWGLGVMGLARVPLDSFNGPTPILILAIAAGHAVQLLKRYYEEYNRLRDASDLSPREASREAIVASVANVGPVMVTAGAVAALSFFSLVVFEISTIRTFGVFTGVGIASAILLELTLIPALRSWLPPPSDRERRLERTFRVWDAIPRAIAGLVTGPKRGLIVLGALALVALSVAGIGRLKVENSNKSFFGRGLPFQRDDDLLNARLGGTNTLYVVVDGGAADAIKDPRVLRGIDAVQRFIERQPHVGKAVSLADFVKRMNQAMHGDDPRYAEVPDDRDLISQYLLLYSLSGDPNDFSSYVDYAYRMANVMVFMKTGSTAEVEALIARVGAFAREQLGDRARVRIGGSGPQTAALTEVMVRGKVRNIVQIAAMILVMSSLLFRSITAGLLVLTPLSLAVLANFGLMGLSGMPLNIPNSLSSAMAVGIGADYAIYLLYRLREELGRGSDMEAAVRDTLATAGKASLFVASAVAGGYGVLLFSFGFRVHNWLAVLIGTAMVVGVFASLTIIPAMILTLRPRFIYGQAPVLSPRAALGGLGVALALAVVTAGGGRAAEPSPEAIMEKNLAVSKVADSSTRATFMLINGSGGQRTRTTVGFTRLSSNGYDNMRLTRFTTPPDVKGTGILMIEHNDRDDEMWVWLPALRKVRRLVSASKRESFMGTDLSYGDVIGHKVEEWTHRLLGEEDVDGQPCYVVESLPKTAEVRQNSGYGRRVSWVSKGSFVTVKGEFWDEAGQLLKRYRSSDVRLLDPAKQKWQAMTVEASNVQTGHRTVIRIEEIKVNRGVREDVFTTRYLERQ